MGNSARRMLWSQHLPEHKTRRGLHSVAIYTSETLHASRNPDEWAKGKFIVRTTLFIELKYDADVSDEYLKGIMLDAAKSAAKLLLTQASMVCTTRKPEIAVRTNNSIDGTEHIEVFDAADREG